MSNITFSVQRYLDCLNLQVEGPSLKYLEKICHANLHIFPFENISKLLFYHRRLPFPSFDLFTNNYFENNFGGTCYILNTNLKIFLESIGFECYHVMLGEEHMGIIVNINNDKYYVDCGAAAPLFKPIRIDNTTKSVSSFGRDEIYILPVDSEGIKYKYDRFTNGKQSGRTWHFEPGKEAIVSDFEAVIKKSNKPAAPFMNILRCQLYQTTEQRSVSLVNNKFSIQYANGDINIMTLSSEAEVQEVLSEEFKLPNIPVKEAIHVLETLNVDIFASNTN
ncbi:arylamine N-acetyltransferase [Sutcliffiella rhizosphaerae]|uniref:Arylamine N-acetyltransferase n=1 Tax=Sutcliffiella rhizosphaerae TaxID=2880967 RepID=A0ABM8YNI1_9BACI|nr:arylamine N-acetyltransferase [Sutcliffiella rhizosphaerae]CAG9621558.1 hypothetical protein BACCIP111883_02331 [Sutcliffiella rhizosphaerae]